MVVRTQLQTVSPWVTYVNLSVPPFAYSTNMGIKATAIRTVLNEIKPGEEHLLLVQVSQALHKESLAKVCHSQGVCA